MSDHMVNRMDQRLEQSEAELEHVCNVLDENGLDVENMTVVEIAVLAPLVHRGDGLQAMTSEVDRLRDREQELQREIKKRDDKLSSCRHRREELAGKLEKAEDELNELKVMIGPAMLYRIRKYLANEKLKADIDKLKLELKREKSKRDRERRNAQKAEARLKEIERLKQFKDKVDFAWSERAWPSRVMDLLTKVYEEWEAKRGQHD